jgi:hypothetical protein
MARHGAEAAAAGVVWTACALLPCMLAPAGRRSFCWVARPPPPVANKKICGLMGGTAASQAPSGLNRSLSKAPM